MAPPAEIAIDGSPARRDALPAVFLDRDGTLNVKPAGQGYLRSAAQFEWLPGAAQGAAALAHGGFTLFVVSNQRGVARGLVDEPTLLQTEAEIQAVLGLLGARIAAFRYCRHDLADRCDCRKPAPGMILTLAHERGLDLQRSWVIGDALTDIAAGKAAGCRTALVGTSTRLPGGGVAPDLVSPSLLQASKQIMSGRFRRPL